MPALRVPTDLAWTVVQMRAGERIIVNEALIVAYQAASSSHSICALKSDLEAFDAWCRRTQRVALPATPEVVADYLDTRAGKGSRPASLARYKASIAKIHQLLDLKDPTSAPLVKLRLAVVRREKGTAQKQARPLRFKGPVTVLDDTMIPHGYHHLAWPVGRPFDDWWNTAQYWADAHSAGALPEGAEDRIVWGLVEAWDRQQAHFDRMCG